MSEQKHKKEAERQRPESLARARVLVETALAREPRLTYQGIGAGFERGRPVDIVGKRFAEERAKLLSDEGLAQVETCARWLEQQRTTKSLNRSGGSYSYKHRAERWGAGNQGMSYVSNGALIAAAIGLGLRYAQVHPRSLNVYLNLSKRQLPPCRGALL